MFIWLRSAGRNDWIGQRGSCDIDGLEGAMGYTFGLSCGEPKWRDTIASQVIFFIQLPVNILSL